LELNKELEMPILPQRIAVISSATAAGFGDFCDQLRSNAYGFYFKVELFAAMMQGGKVEESVLQALDRINDRLDEFDVVVIIRGGGATSDLADFDSYILASVCAQFPLPIITGIGHERDDTVLDMVAHSRVKTPTAAPELLVQCMAEAAERLAVLKNRLCTGVNELLKRQGNRLNLLSQAIFSGADRKLSNAKSALRASKDKLAFASHKCLTEKRHQLSLWLQKVNDAAPEKLLARGYSLTLKDGHVVKDLNIVQVGDEIVTLMAGGNVISEVQQIEYNKEK